MQIVNRSVKYIGDDVILKVNIGASIGSIGKQEIINELVGEYSKSLVNPIIDNEVCRFKYDNNSQNFGLYFYFYNGNSYDTDFRFNGFDDNDLKLMNTTVSNSFFILDFYDDYNPYTQNKISTKYISKIHTLNGKSIYNIYPKDITKALEFNYCNIPYSYINNQVSNISIGYLRISFYNAKTGRLSTFFNKDINDNPTLRLTQQKMYFKVRFDLYNHHWSIETPSYSSVRKVNAYELPQSNGYAKRLDDTIDKIPNIKQNYPNGNLFNTNTIDYEI